MLQIYNEKVQDLLADAKVRRVYPRLPITPSLFIVQLSRMQASGAKTSLDIKRGPRGNYVDGLFALRAV